MTKWCIFGNYHFKQSNNQDNLTNLGMSKQILRYMSQYKMLHNTDNYKNANKINRWNNKILGKCQDEQRRSLHILIKKLL